jgi:ribosomal protein S18 acetylase RimI-like enzyme
VKLAFRKAEYDADAPVLRKMVKGDPFISHFAHIAYCNRQRFQKGDIIVATVRKKIVGFAVTTRVKTARQTKINILGVDPTVRSQGIGAQIIDYVQETALYKNIYLDVRRDNERAIAFYRREGFKPIGVNENANALIMARAGERTLL